ncbi:MAG: hypothetical protein U9N39_07755 [Campylobacterota bacterium]|nr:hypothetical protein [Campylobacterota bacterium]
MKLILHLFITLVLLFGSLGAIEFRDMQEISLKKDEQTKILVKYKDSVRLFKLRWTLYVNEGLVLFHSYDKQVAQNILYLNTKNQSFKVYLKTRGADHYEPPYFLVKFKEFDYGKNSASFELFLSDKKSQIEIEYLGND